MLHKLFVAVLALLTTARVTQAQVADSLVDRVQRLVVSGQRPAARALADSAIMVRTVGTTAYAEALYARAYTMSDAASAEREYLRLSVEYPLSPRAADALSQVGQYRVARSDRVGARRAFERLVLDYRSSPQAPRAAYWAGRLAQEDGDLASGCTSLFFASERADRGDVELQNQIRYYYGRCAMPGGSTRRADPPPTEPSRAEQPEPRGTTAVAKQYSVQVGAFARRRDADALYARLKARQFPVRVAILDGVTAPYRVRVGFYESREAAAAAVERMKRARVPGFVVEAEGL